MCDLITPRYTQPEVLQVTRLSPPVLQTWINRSAIQLTEQNPGYGRRRLYSSLDVIKLAVMRRLADLRIALATSRDIAEAAAQEIAEKGMMDWNLFIFLRPAEATASDLAINIISSPSRLAAYSPTIGDARNMPIWDYLEPFEGFIGSRRERHSGTVNPNNREALARAGIHAEPVIVFPLGEIVNGALAQLRAIDEQLQYEGK